jgi:hypothetical protein
LLRHTLADGDDAAFVQPLDVQLREDEVAKLEKGDSAGRALIREMEEVAGCRWGVLET